MKIGQIKFLFKKLKKTISYTWTRQDTSTSYCSDPVEATCCAVPADSAKRSCCPPWRSFFTGERGRFEGLWINDESDYAFPRHPVVSLSLSMSPAGPDALREGILAGLRRIADLNKVKVQGSAPDTCFPELVKALHNRHGAKVVVLVDEYDAPVTARLDDLDVAKANAHVIDAFLSQLKRMDVLDSLRLTMVAGLTHYAPTPRSRRKTAPTEGEAADARGK